MKARNLLVLGAAIAGLAGITNGCKEEPKQITHIELSDDYTTSQ